MRKALDACTVAVCDELSDLAVTGDSSKRAVVVLGMHRSGTSALTRSVSLAGYALPGDLMPARPDNAKGFWESLAVMRLNDAVLEEIGTRWDRPGPFLCPAKTFEQSSDIVARFIRGKFRERAAVALKTAFGGGSAIVLKDPRICLLLPLWRQTLEDAGYSARFLVIYRNPLEVAESLGKRNAIPLRRSLQLWLHYNLSYLRALGCEDDSCEVVSFPELVSEPEATIGRLVETGMITRISPGGLVELREFIASSDRHFQRSAAELTKAPHIPATIKRLWNLLGTWNRSTPEVRAKTFGRVYKDFHEAMLLTGRTVQPQIKISPAGESKREQPPAQRTPVKNPGLIGRGPWVRIIHYHLFKNAGTSVDEMLRRNFGSHWTEQEFPAENGRSNCDSVAEFLRDRPELVALSSHTALLPIPQLVGELIVPILFLRHPIMRISSAYAFEKRQDADTFGARLAKQADFRAYVETLLAAPGNRSARNFQTYRLAFNEPGTTETELERAMRTIRTLPFVGLVEAYSESLNRFEQLVKPYFPNFKALFVRENVSRTEDDTLDEELANIRRQLGDDLYSRLLENNRKDCEVFNEVSRLFAPQQLALKVPSVSGI
jgi:hypothetical protein